MPRQSIILQVFVASPSDVSEERVILETVVTHLNQVWSGNLGVTFELLKWETHVRPAFTTDPQSAVNEQIGSEYDVFIGIFWGRVGTPTLRAPSGSIEEFDRALARLQEDKNLPEIMLYFKDAPIAPSKIDIDQLRGVQEFRSSLSGKGGLFSVFEDQSGFESSLRAHLSAIAQKFASRGSAPSSHAAQGSGGVPAPVESRPTLVEEDDYGYMDYIEIYAARQTEMTSAITAINDATVRIGEQLTQRSADVQADSSGDAKEARRLVKRAADDMSSYADTLNAQMSVLAASRESAFAALSNALVLHGDFGARVEDLRTFRATLTSLVESTATAKTGMAGMRTAVSGLPRVSKELNHAKRAVVTQLDAFVSEIDSTASTVHNIIEAIDRMLP